MYRSLLLATTLVACAGPQTVTEEPASRPASAEPVAPVQGEPLPLDSTFVVGKLGNGLSYYIRRNERPENRAAFWLVVNVGSVLENADQRGLAHFLEHMAFNGTRDFDKLELVDYLESIGMRFGPDLNAFTSFDETVYMLEVPMDSVAFLDKAILILQNWAGGIMLEDEEIDKERGVVVEELRAGRGSGARIQDKQFPVLFHGSRYAERLPIGLQEVLEDGPASAIRQFYADWYRPDLMAVIAVGDLDPAEIEGRIREGFAGLQNPGQPLARTVFPVPAHDETLVSVVTDPEATSTQVVVYQKLPKRPVVTDLDFRRTLLDALYHGMLNLRFNEIRQKPDAPFLFAGSGAGSFVRSADVHLQQAGVKEGGVLRGLQSLLTEAERVRRHGFTDGELSRAKTNVLRAFDQVYEERDRQFSRSYAAGAMSHFLTGAPMPGTEVNVELVRRFVPGITLDEVNERARESVGESSRVITVSGPEKEDAPLPTREELLAVFEDVAGSPDIEPWEDDALEQPLVAEKPRPGIVVRESSIEELGVTEWRLLNGVEVVLKPTDFQNDQVLIRGSGPGGHSLVEDADFVSAQYATMVMSAGGLGEFDQIQLGKALAGKIASASASISETSESVSGRGSPKDIETLFQLIYLHFTAPRLDVEAATARLDQIRAGIENRDASPRSVFSDQVGEKWSQGHHRRRPASGSLLDEINLTRAEEIYRDRFSDASDFRFVIVGNFEVEEIKPHVITWLGGLPSTKREETWRDVGVTRPDGVVEVEVNKGLEPQSQVDIRFHGEMTTDRESIHILSSLADAVRIRLREVLREDMGGVYGVGVSGRSSRIPRHTYTFSIQFGCAPENVESLEKAVFDEIERIKREGVDEDLIQKVKEAQRRSRETSLEQNGFWLSVLGGYYTRDEDPRLILAHDDLVELVTSENLQQMAIERLDTGRVLIGRLFPE